LPERTARGLGGRLSEPPLQREHDNGEEQAEADAQTNHGRIAVIERREVA
jgi:hypothetical protein